MGLANSASTSSIHVLIIGAGPVGLFLANECERRSLRWRLIEQRPRQSEHSKALAVMPRTLEIFDMAGIVAPFLEAANRVTLGRRGDPRPSARADSVYPARYAVPVCRDGAARRDREPPRSSARAPRRCGGVRDLVRVGLPGRRRRRRRAGPSGGSVCRFGPPSSSDATGLTAPSGISSAFRSNARGTTRPSCWPISTPMKPFPVTSCSCARTRTARSLSFR